MRVSPQILLIGATPGERDHLSMLLSGEFDPPPDWTDCADTSAVAQILRAGSFDILIMVADAARERQTALEPWLCNLPLTGPQPLLLLREFKRDDIPQSTLPTFSLRHLTPFLLRQSIDDAVQRRRALRESLRGEIAHALVRGEMELRFQPVLDLQHGRIDHLEVLLRWRHPLYGLIGPEHFLDVAESSGAIHPLGIWVLRRALEQQLRWGEQGLPLLPVSINVADCQLERDTFGLALNSCLETGGTVALGLEINADELARCSGTVRRQLSEWHERGVQLTADHIGSAQTAAPLQGLPLDAMKLDRHLLHRCESDPEQAAALRAVLELGQSLGCDTIASGVEHRATARFLRRQRCDHLQGFWVARPLNGSEVTRWIGQLQQ